MRRSGPLYRQAGLTRPYFREELAKVLRDPAIEAFAEDCISAYALSVAVNEMGRLAHGLARCESPIERRLAIAMAFMDVPLFFAEDGRRHPITPGEFSEKTFRERFKSEGLAIYSQAQIGRHRVDFLIVALFQDRPALHFLVVECDGHDFHERTKEQARRDRSRDRDLLIGDRKVMRFTGSEIHSDAEKCAAQISDYLFHLEYQTRPV